jgi:hypothetical protein
MKMKILKTSILLILISFNSFSQSYLKEISKTFNNGSPMFIDYLEPDNLKKVKTEIFDESGRKIFSIQFNPNTGLPEGEFFDLINKGFFKEGVLTCYNCLLVDSNSPSVFTYNYNKMNTRVTQGDVINGYLVGEIQYKSFAEDTYRGIDYESSRRYAAAGAGLGFRDVVTYKTGNFKEYNLGRDFLNSKGAREGESIINFGNWYAKLYYKNGIIKKYVAYDSKNISIDSISNDNPIWKINYKFVKNDGFIVFKDVNSFLDPLYDNKLMYRNFVKIRPKIDEMEIIPVGGIQAYVYELENQYFQGGEVNGGGVKLGLDNNGLYSFHKLGFFDNIAYYVVNSNYQSQSGKSPNLRNPKTGNNYDESTAIFKHIYNYLFYNQSKDLAQKIYTEDNECNASLDNNLKFIVNALNAESISSSEVGSQKEYLISEFNPFKKYLKNANYNTYKNFKTISTYKYITLSDFFDQYISLSDFLSASRESIDNGHSEIQELWIWDSSLDRYVLFDFNKAIELAKKTEESTKKTIKEIVVNKEEVSSTNSQNTDEEKITSNDYLDPKNNLALISLISNSEIRYSSEKKTKHYYRPYEKQKEEINKIYDLDLVSINILKPSNEDQVINYITEFSFASDKNIKKFSELMISDKQYKFYHSNSQKFKIYYKFSDSKK